MSEETATDIIQRIAKSARNLVTVFSEKPERFLEDININYNFAGFDLLRGYIKLSQTLGVGNYSEIQNNLSEGDRIKLLKAEVQWNLGINDLETKALSTTGDALKTGMHFACLKTSKVYV